MIAAALTALILLVALLARTLPTVEPAGRDDDRAPRTAAPAPVEVAAP